jgi:hypothetical protein
MKRRVVSVLLIVAALALSSPAHAQEKMTAENFREIAASPGDDLPLDAKLLAVGPLWTNVTVTIDLTYADGKKFHETIPGSLRTVKGKYIVATVNSALYKQPVNTITAYDETTTCYKSWGLYGDMLTEAITVFTPDFKTCSIYSAFGEGSWELGVGSSTETKKWTHTLVMKNSVLFCTRDVTSVPAKPAAK